MCPLTLNNMEFYNTPEGDVMVKEVGKPAYQLKDIHRELIAELLRVIRELYPKAHDALMKLYSASTMNRTYYEYRVVHRFLRCNFGNYNQELLDVDHHGAFHFEEVGCPLRGECIYEGVICRPKLETHLSDREMEVFRLIAVDHLQADQIAEELHISSATVDRHRNNIRMKIGAKNVAEMVAYWMNHQLK